MLEAEARMVENVIKHAILKERTLIFVDGDASSRDVDRDTMIAVHPNYVTQ